MNVRKVTQCGLVASCGHRYSIEGGMPAVDRGADSPEVIYIRNSQEGTRATLIPLPHSSSTHLCIHSSSPQSNITLIVTQTVLLNSPGLTSLFHK